MNSVPSVDDSSALDAIRSRFKLQIAAYKLGDSRFADVIGASQVAFVGIDAAGAVNDCNAAAMAMFERNVADLIGCPIVDALRVERSDEFARFVAAVLSGGEVGALRLTVLSRTQPSLDVLIEVDGPAVNGLHSLYLVDCRSFRMPVGEALADVPLSTALDAVPAMISYWDRNLRCRYANRPYLQWFKRTAEEIPDLTAEQILGTELFRANGPYMQAALRGKRQSFTRTLTLESGEIRHTWAQYLPDLLEGEVRGIYVVATDVTELVRAEEVRREADARLRLATEASNTGIWDMDLGTRQVYFSDVWKRQLGYADDELENCFETWSSHVHPEDLALGLAKVEASSRPPWPSYEFEHRLRHKDGSYRWILSKASVQRNAAGNPVRLMGSHLDISDRKAAEVALAQSEMRFRAVIEASPVPYALVDHDGVISYVNPQFTATYGYELADIPTRNAWWERAYPDPDYRRWVTAAFRDRLERACRSGGVYEPLEVIVQCKDGSRRSAISFVGDLEGAYKGTHLGIMMDVTEQRLLERSLMEASMREQHRIGMNLHDGLGQELTGLSLMLAALMKRLPHASTPEIGEELARIADIARRALDSTREVAHGLSPIEPGIAGLFQAIHRLAAAMQAASGVEIRVTLAGAASDARLEQPALESIFRITQEAITNAIRHARGTRVDVTAEVKPSMIELSVADNGAGLPTETAAEGFGINGMRFRVRALGGRIEIRNSPHGGAVVQCWCPISPAPNALVA